MCPSRDGRDGCGTLFWSLSLKLTFFDMAKTKFYAVAVGRDRGIFTDWPSAQKLVTGYGGAKYKSFATRQEAEEWLENPQYTAKSGKKVAARKSPAQKGVVPNDFSGIVVYTDGGSINNPGPGGYGVVINEDGSVREISGGFRYTTNNRMEMTAAIIALRELRHCGRPILLYSDSSYLVNGIEKGWARSWRKRGWSKSDGEPALNTDLWEELLELIETMDVRLCWVKGHAGNEYNERCDQLAVASARSPGLPPDKTYERLTGKSG